MGVSFGRALIVEGLSLAASGGNTYK